MANSIDTAFIKQFESDVHMAYQRMGSKLRNTVRTVGNVAGSVVRFQKIAKGSASTKSRNGNVTPMEFRNWLQSKGEDPRKNHFSSPNHYKIADIYYKALTDKNYIPDFTTLEQNIYDELPKLGMSPGMWIK